MTEARITRLGRYELHAAIASGGMASVYLGRMRSAAGVMRTVAVKRMHQHVLAEPDARAMFFDEARLAMRIQHPNVVAAFDVIAVDDELLLVMDFVLGESLDGLLRAARRASAPTPVSIVCGVLAGTLAGLHAAHEAKDESARPLGLVHRDVSPQNVLVGVDGAPRVIDFGVAKAAGRLHATELGRVKGKLAYMAPEQLTLGEIDRRADVFAAAVILWEGLTGHRLFGAESPGATVTNVLDKVVAAPSTLRPDLPPALDAVVLRGLSRRPEERFASAWEMAVALEGAHPAATTREIGEWVEREAREAIGARAALLAEVESRSPSVLPTRRAPGETSTRSPPLDVGRGAARPAPYVPADGETQTSSAVRSSPELLSPRGRRSRRVAQAIVAAAATALAAWTATRLSVAPHAAATTTAPPPSASAPTSPAPPQASSPAETPDGAVEGAPPDRARRVPPAGGHKPDCRNPFTVGQGGIRVPRPECF